MYGSYQGLALASGLPELPPHALVVGVIYVDVDHVGRAVGDVTR